METFGIVSEFYVARNVVDGVSAGRILGTVRLIQARNFCRDIGVLK